MLLKIMTGSICDGYGDYDTDVHVFVDGGRGKDVMETRVSGVPRCQPKCSSSTST